VSVNIRTPISYGKYYLEIPVATAKFYREHMEEYLPLYLSGLDAMTTKGSHAKNILEAITELFGIPFIDRHHDPLVSPIQLELF